MQEKSLHKWAWILLVSVIWAVVGAKLFTKGMFADGQQYAVIAMNLANGKGSFWYPYLFETWPGLHNLYFLEQPQLGYWIESWWFRLFDNHYMTEKIFCLSMLAVNAFLIHLIWKKNIFSR